MKAILSLFDYSGIWAEPWRQNGFEVVQWDIKLNEFMDINFFKDVETTLDFFADYDIQGILAGPPCTDFAVSGAQYWPAKDQSGQTENSLELVRQVQRLANLFLPTDPDYFEENPDAIFFWVAENPVGRMGKLAGLDDPYYFHPHDFAGYLNPKKKDLAELSRIRTKAGIDITAEENDFVVRMNAYTKKTGLWGDFNRQLVKKSIEPVKCAPQGSFTQRLGGKSAKTKELRSMTPEGFAWAFYEANKSYQAEYQG